MRIHKEGIGIIVTFLVIVALINTFYFWRYGGKIYIDIAIPLVSFLLLLFILNFFRHPNRIVKEDDHIVYSPADGEVVVIEEAFDNEYFHEKRLQVSIFMSIWDVHKNWIPIGGTISYYKYHPGKYLIARLPKSSELNEHTSTVIKTSDGREILVKQIAGAVARRIICHMEEGKKVSQNDELGFIRFGSRVDLLLPLGTKVDVELGQKVQGNITKICGF